MLVFAVIKSLLLLLVRFFFLSTSASDKARAQSDRDALVPDQFEAVSRFPTDYPGELIETETGRDEHTGKFSEEKVRNACERGGIQNGDMFMTYQHIKKHYDDFYNSGAELYVGGLSGTLMQFRQVIVDVCPLIALQTLVLELENTMAVTYTDAYSEIAVQQKRLKKSAEIVAEFTALYHELSSDVTYDGLLRLVEGWNIVSGWERADKYRQWFAEDIQAGKDAYADHLGTDVDKQKGLSDEDFTAYYHSSFKEIADIFTNEMKLDWFPIRGTLIALMRYGAAGARELRNHPDFLENDIDIVIGVKDEQEWSYLQKTLTLVLEKWSPDVKCFVKTTVQPHEGVQAAQEVHDFYHKGKTNAEIEAAGGHREMTEDDRIKPLPVEYFRKDLLYCIRKQPATLLIDINSYIRDTDRNIAYGHRTFRSRAAQVGDWSDIQVDVKTMIFGDENRQALDLGEGQKGGMMPLGNVHDFSKITDREDFVIHPWMGAFRNTGTDYLELQELQTGNEQPCRVHDFAVPCPRNPGRTLAAMLIEDGAERSCFALPGPERLANWTAADWGRFVDYQDELREQNFQHMGPYLWTLEACRGQIEHFLLVEKEEDKVAVLERIRTNHERFYRGFREVKR
ncbi:unnamed protein product [Amoebophrya sp. A120]|nr:unnamed protein product [Amoebophrya sp. A120]|eukprot:GSA120T00002335001.1